ncbi:hypothetical protein NDU88_000948 [Pleurodeles waltl]|uniref:Uncharacterized protein n=1 Tax=Pleurodeles waltl TaxID=8319 RepID=A0AAV7S5Z3_PLEWA|nr:hypothetical protein NDU88_000948 [Pleurodeles waltl]
MATPMTSGPGSRLPRAGHGEAAPGALSAERGRGGCWNCRRKAEDTVPQFEATQSKNKRRGIEETHTNNERQDNTQYTNEALQNLNPTKVEKIMQEKPMYFTPSHPTILNAGPRVGKRGSTFTVRAWLILTALLYMLSQCEQNIGAAASPLLESTFNWDDCQKESGHLYQRALDLYNATRVSAFALPSLHPSIF